MRLLGAIGDKYEGGDEGAKFFLILGDGICHFGFIDFWRDEWEEDENV
jgi:hypothetical protein